MELMDEKEAGAVLKKEENRRKEGDKWISRIRNARYYEDLYRRQATTAYALYNRNYSGDIRTGHEDLTFADITRDAYRFGVKNNRANIFYANIEALMSLVLPSVPQFKAHLRQKPEVNDETRERTKFYDLAVKIIEEACQWYIYESLTKDDFRNFKLDYFITGRGVLWVDYVPSSNEGELSRVDVDYVHWLDFAYDPKLKWQEVRWVGRRKFLSEQKLQELYPGLDFEEFQFSNDIYNRLSQDSARQMIDTTYMRSGGKYAEIWEIWDKYTKLRLIVSDQYIDKIIDFEAVEGVQEKMFFPTPPPPVGIKNGVDLRPTSEIWSYLPELRQLSYISARKEELLRGLQLKGFVSSENRDLVQQINNAQDGSIYVAAMNPQNPQAPVTYIDNKPKVEMLSVLSQEHDSLKNNIYEISGISDQMRQVSAQSDAPEETATEVKTKTTFGSRRLREKQDVLAEYFKDVYTLVFQRVCSTIKGSDLSRITSVTLVPSLSRELAQTESERQQLKAQIQGAQQQMQQMPPPQPPQDQQDPNAPPPPPDPAAQQQQQMSQQIEQMQQQLTQLETELQAMRDEPTWEAVSAYMKMVSEYSVSIEVDLDDAANFIAKTQLTQQSMMDAQSLLGIMGQVAQSVLGAPKLADVYTSILSAMVEGSMYNYAQKRAIEDFVVSLKKQAQDLVNTPPQPPPPDPNMIKAQAAQMMAQAKMQEVQGKGQEYQTKDTLAQSKTQVDQAEAAMRQAQAALYQAQAQKEMAPEEEDEDYSNPPPDVELEVEEQHKEMEHERDMEKVRLQIEAQNNRAKDKMEADAHLMKMKIQADDNRYEKKMEFDSQNVGTVPQNAGKGD
jgi:hypothetical protein